MFLLTISADVINETNLLASKSTAIAYLHLSFSNTLSVSLKISQARIKGFWEGKGEEAMRPPFSSSFHKLLLKTLPNFTITAMNITTQKAPLPMSVRKESHSSPGDGHHQHVLLGTHNPPNSPQITWTGKHCEKCLYETAVRGFDDH